jgi:hypothetical protein
LDLKVLNDKGQRSLKSFVKKLLIPTPWAHTLQIPLPPCDIHSQSRSSWCSIFRWIEILSSWRRWNCQGIWSIRYSSIRR